jgi:hypothetical protein
MSKLKPKGIVAETPIGLSEIARMIKTSGGVPINDEVRDETETEKGEVREEEVRNNSLKENRNNAIVRETKFSNILAEIENKEYACTGVIYIDEEIKEVLSLLKSKAKIKTSSLVSYILEHFLEENKEDINTIIRSSNRFL